MNDPELLEEFIIESRELLSKAEEDILALEGCSSEQYKELINSIFRSVHTIKGGSGFLELAKINKLSHSLESVAGLIRSAKLTPTSNIIENFLTSIDKLKLLISNVSDDSMIDVKSEINAFEKILKSDGASPKEKSANKPKTLPDSAFNLFKYDIQKAINKKQYVFELSLDLIAECKAKGRMPSALVGEIKSVAEFWDSSVDLKDIDTIFENKDKNLCTFIFATVIDDVEIFVLGLNINPIKVKRYKPVELEELLKTGPQTADKKEDENENSPASENSAKVEEGIQSPGDKEPSKSKATTVSADNTVRISLNLLDKLMNLATELVLVRNQNTMAVNMGNIPQLTLINQRLNVVTSDLQNGIMQTRMRPVGNIFNRFNRVVRDLAKKLGKSIELEVIGSEVELDKSIIESISDPLTHLLRNSVDHGIEEPKTREKQGKSPVGKVILKAIHEAGQVNIQIEDDGKGMDPEVLKQAAVNKGLITKEQADLMSKRDAFNIIFEPGFSTAQKITEVSGRGVGMDVVKSGFQKLGGTIDISSEVGIGTVISIKLPLTLAIIPALIVNVEKNYFAIPQVNIMEVVWLHGEELYQTIKSVDKKEVYWLRGKLLPLLRLSEVLEIHKTYVDKSSSLICRDRRKALIDRRNDYNGGKNNEKRNGLKERRISDSNSVFIVVLRVGNNRMGVVVDKIIDTEEIVVKSLHDQLKKCGLYAGTTILGDGNIAMILDILALSEAGEVRFGENESGIQKKSIVRGNFHSSLLFDIGGHERFAIPLFLINRVQEVRKKDIHIANKREYLNYMGNMIPLLRIDKTIDTIKGTYENDLLYVIIPKSRKTFGILATNILDTLEIAGEFDADVIPEAGINGTQLINGKLILFVDPFKIADRAGFGSNKDSSGKQTRILLFDENIFYQKIIASLLGSQDMPVTVCMDLEDAFKQADSEKFDAIICNIEIPDIEGFELAKHVRKNDSLKNIPLLAISSHEEEIIRQRALDSGFDLFHSKMHLEGLFNVINNSLKVKKVSVS